ncbi:DUF3025 domain-containing protein [Pseudoalteromonas byunsanensis]|uniref:DUF3025 domain-containing protein n=1 Tax=Pseudoalteromonas byunsanensis TaxID=327939 RepID=A0A1S1N657_9GAMM|nr:DUF3025 domain-containing protein [Pseudoalteromonas byunsanensis]OHU96627.1 hypothetical protein BIW53_04670 [Pseudoalteromonas byunsanensis]
MKKFTPPETFDPQLLSGGAFEHLNHIFKLNEHNNWPTFGWLNALGPVQNRNGKALEFVPDALLQDETRYYEQIIYETGRVPTREQNWHDLFGVMIWCLFPKTKALLNKQHIVEIDKHGLKQRSKHRNALTLFDECGVVLAMTNGTFAEQLKNHCWVDAFVAQRSGWDKEIKAFIFGHANYEMLTQPFIGLTGKALCVEVDETFFELDLHSQYACLDTLLVDMIENQGVLNDNTQLSPLPLLGIPNWFSANQSPEFYNNTNYFRAKRRNTHDRSQSVKKTLQADQSTQTKG